MFTNADFIALHADALAQVTAIVGDCFLYNGTTYAGIINDVETVSTLLEGGQLEGLATLIIVSKAELPVAPTIGKTLKVGSKTLRVEKVKSDEVSHELTCVSAAN